MINDENFYAGLIGENAVFLNGKIYDEIKHYPTINLCIDGTFSCVPKLYKQLFVVLVEKEHRVSTSIY